MLRRRARRGFGLIEFTVVFAVMGTVIGAIWVAYDSYSYQRKLDETIDGIFYVAVRAKDVFKGSPSGNWLFQNGTACIPVIHKLVPDSWITEVGRTQCTWYGAFLGSNIAISLPINSASNLTVWMQGPEPGNLTTARIGLGGLTQRDCANIYSRLTVRSAASNNFLPSIFPNSMHGSFGFNGPQRAYTYQEALTFCNQPIGNYMEILSTVF